MSPFDSSLYLRECPTASESSDIQVLFNGKAQFWRRKYAPGGALNARLEKFTLRLPNLCAPPASVLDLGCGTGDISVAMSRIGYEVTACDIAECMVGAARGCWSGIPVKWISLSPGWTQLPFKDSSFGGVVASSVFEYLDDLKGVTAELSRVLRSGGVVLFSVPNPFSMIRRAEALLRHMLPADGPSRLPLGFARVDAYMAYLRLSRNRLTGERWRAVLAQASLVPVDESEFAEETWRRQSKATMMLLAARKADG